MLLFFDDKITLETKSFKFNKTESKHLTKVLRKGIGTLISITNGNGLEWCGKINELNNKYVSAIKIESFQHSLPQKKIHLAIAPTKNSDRMEWLVEKLTELGIASITPILCDRSQRKVIKRDRFVKIAVAALKQSQQFFLPDIKPLIRFNKLLISIQHQGFIAHCEKTEKKLISKLDISMNEVTILIGPEGDFTPLEIREAKKVGLTAISLGKQRFRTETAALLGCHSLFIQQQKFEK